MQRRVVITGMGAITPLGNSVEQLYRAQIAGVSGARPITRFDARTFPTTFAAEVRDFELSRYVADPGRWINAGANGQFAAAAARVALAESGLLPGAAVDRTQIGVYLGSGEGIQDFEYVAVMPTSLYGYARVLQLGKREPVQIESAPVAADRLAFGQDRDAVDPARQKPPRRAHQ